MYSICIQYFSYESGISKTLLESVELNYEHLTEVFEMLKTAVDECCLDVNNVSAYSAEG